MIDRYVLVVDTTLRENQNKSDNRNTKFPNKGPDMTAPPVQFIFNTTDKLYMRLVGQLQKLMVDIKGRESRGEVFNLDLVATKAAAFEASEFSKAATKMKLWNRLKLDQLWWPSARFQLDYKHLKFQEEFKGRKRVGR